MYQTTIRLKSEKLKTKRILSSSFEVVKGKICYELKKGSKKLKLTDMSICICNKLEVPSLIQQVIFGLLENRLETKYSMDQIKDFSLLKRVFDSGSILVDCEKVMILPIWKSILSELKAYSKVRQIIGYNNATNATPKNNTVTPKTNNNDSNDYLWRIICISVFEVNTAIYKVNMNEPMSNYNSSCFKAFNNTLENDKSYQLGPKPAKFKADDELRSNLSTSRLLFNNKSILNIKMVLDSSSYLNLNMRDDHYLDLKFSTT